MSRTLPQHVSTIKQQRGSTKICVVWEREPQQRIIYFSFATQRCWHTLYWGLGVAPAILRNSSWILSLFLKRRLPRCRPDCIKSLLNKIFKQPAKENTPLYVCKSLRTLHGRGAWKLGRLWTRDDHDNPTSAAHIGYHVNFTRYVILTVHMLCHIVKRESCDRFGKKVQNGKVGTVILLLCFTVRLRVMIVKMQ